MTIGKELEKRNHVIGFKEEIEKAKNNSKDDFFIWFNDAKNADESFIKGAWDFSIHIASEMAGYVREQEKKTILEIGHGGGRLLAAASRYFQKAYGVDIHNENEFVIQELNNRCVKNINLIKSSDGKSIPLEDKSVDVVYSFIVLQHVEKIDIFKSYIEEIYRVLSNGGVAVIYFGRHCKFSHNKKSKLFCLVDRLLEFYFLPNGYKEKESKVNEVNLTVSLNYAIRLCNKIGFKIEKRLISKRRMDKNKNVYGGQHGLVLLKR